MKRTIKISMLLLLLGIAGQGQAYVGHYGNTSHDKNHSVFANDKDKKKKSTPEDRHSAGEPFFRTDDSVVSMNLLNLDEGPVEVKVYDGDDRVLYSEIICGEASVGKRFDFSEVSDGVYTIVVKDETRQYFKKVDKL